MLNVLYSLPNSTQMFRTRRMRWMGRVTYWGEQKCIQEFGRKMVGNRSEDRSIDAWIILK